jgi:hypothetical protein
MDAAPRLRRNRRVLVTIAEFYEANVGEPDRALVAACSGYQRPTQPGFRAALTALRQAHHVTYPTGRTVSLTERGRAQVVAGPIDAVTGNDDVHDRLAASLTGAQRNLFRELSDGRDRERLEVAQALGYENALVSPPSHESIMGALPLPHRCSQQSPSALQTPGFRALVTQLNNRGLLSLASPATLQLSDVAFPFGR